MKGMAKPTLKPNRRKINTKEIMSVSLGSINKSVQPVLLFTGSILLCKLKDMNSSLQDSDSLNIPDEEDHRPIVPSPDEADYIILLCENDQEAFWGVDVGKIVANVVICYEFGSAADLVAIQS